MRRSTLLVGSAAGCLLIGTSGTAAAQTAGHEAFQESFEDVIPDFCETGVDVLHTGSVRGIDFLSPANAESARVFHGTETFTAGGPTVTGHFTGRFVAKIVEGVADGAHVTEFTQVGLTSQFKVEGRRVVLHDNGRITFRVTFDANGHEVADEISFLAGPHPQITDPDLYCQVIPAALGIATDQ